MAVLWILLTVPVFGQGPACYVAVHLEPTHTAYYPALVNMVALADSFHCPLTLEFNPQWADTILADPARLSQLRGWQKMGHEIAAHHHDVSYGVSGWDGYTNRPPSDYPVAFKYNGNMQKYFDLLSRLAGDSLLLTLCTKDSEHDWPVGIPYRTDGIMLSEALSIPSQGAFNGQAVTTLGMGLINTRQKVDSAKILYAAAGAGDVLGVVLHEKDFSDNPVNLRMWLQFLKDKGRQVKTVRQIIREYGEATGIGDIRWNAASRANQGIALLEFYPNPFNASATVRFCLTRCRFVCVDLVDSNGRVIRTLLRQYLDAGEHAVRMDALHLPSGLYFMVVKAGGYRKAARVVLLR